MYIVEKYNREERRWKPIFKGHRQASASMLAYTLSKAHPERAYRLIIINSGTLKLFAPEVIYRGGSPVTH